MRQTPSNDDIQIGEIQGFQLATPQPTPYRLYEQPFQAVEYHFYLSEEIIEPYNYTDMIHKINMANASDVIYIHLNTVGGHLDTGVQLINAMTNTPARVITCLEGVAHSLGTIIFLSGDEMIVNEHCLMMFHNFSAGVTGKGNEMVSELNATVKWFEQLARDIYIPFLSEEEVARLVRGEDFWLQSSEIKLRLANMATVVEASDMADPEEDTAQ